MPDEIIVDVCYVKKIKSMDDSHNMFREQDVTNDRSILDTWRLCFLKNGCQSHTVLERACEKRKSEFSVDIDRDDD